MHLGNGAITPGCAVVGLGAAALGVGAALWLDRRGRKQANDATRRMPGPWAFALATGAVFAAQTFNLTVIPGTASGHVMGGFLLGLLFGPLWAIAGMALVLGAQSLLFHDGGLMVLGANVLVMGVLPGLLAYPLWARGRGRGAAGYALTGAGAWASVLVACAGCAALLMSRADARADVVGLWSTMLGTHMLIGLIEAGFTVVAVALIDALAQRPAHVVRPVTLAAMAGLMVAAHFGASPWLDGLEHSMEATGLGELGSGAVTAFEKLNAALAVWPDYSTLFGTLTGAALVLLAAAALASLTRPFHRIREEA